MMSHDLTVPCKTMELTLPWNHRTAFSIVAARDPSLPQWKEMQRLTHQSTFVFGAGHFPPLFFKRFSRAKKAASCIFTEKPLFGVKKFSRLYNCRLRDLQIFYRFSPRKDYLTRPHAKKNPGKQSKKERVLRLPPSPLKKRRG